MHTATVKLVTIVAEAVLRERLITEVRELGASGYTETPVSGEGSRHLRAGEIPGENIKLEVIVGSTAAERLLQLLQQKYFPKYAVIAYVQDVQVLRGEKYARDAS